MILGVALVILSVVVGASVVASGDDRVAVWQAAGDVAAGTVLAADDLRVARVSVPSADRYIPADRVIVGSAVTRPIADGELLPASSIDAGESAIAVLIPVAASSAPTLRRGQRIAVWVSAPSCSTRVLLADAVAQDVAAPRSGALGGSAQLGITVHVDPLVADQIIAAIALPEAEIRVGVLSGSAAAPEPPPAEAGDAAPAGCGAGR